MTIPRLIRLPVTHIRVDRELLLSLLPANRSDAVTDGDFHRSVANVRLSRPDAERLGLALLEFARGQRRGAEILTGATADPPPAIDEQRRAAHEAAAARAAARAVFPNPRARDIATVTGFLRRISNGGTRPAAGSPELQAVHQAVEALGALQGDREAATVAAVGRRALQAA